MGELDSWRLTMRKMNTRKTGTKCKPQRRSTPGVRNHTIVRRNPGRAARPASYISDTSSMHSSKSVDSNSPKIRTGKLVVRLSFCRVNSSEDDNESKADETESEEEEDYYYCKPEPKPRSFKVERFFKEVDDLTEEDIAAVAEKTSDKIYDSTWGTTCHQCRQKTIDTKTICRDRECIGLRGQFCGPCLRNRYGENAKAALLDCQWRCPPCRGRCNCSCCRRKSGVDATGKLIHVAKENGFDSVANFLDSLPDQKQRDV